MTYDGKEIYSKEPKSTLKEEVRIIIHDDIRLTTHEQADKIISLLKDTLLKEMKKYSNIGLVTNEDIEEIIKNL